MMFEVVSGGMGVSRCQRRYAGLPEHGLWEIKGGFVKYHFRIPSQVVVYLTR
jgi:hypothetical protein